MLDISLVSLGVIIQEYYVSSMVERVCVHRLRAKLAENTGSRDLLFLLRQLMQAVQLSKVCSAQPKPRDCNLGAF